MREMKAGKAAGLGRVAAECLKSCGVVSKIVKCTFLEQYGAH